MQNIFRNIIYLLAISGLWQCTERIEIEVDSSYTRLVVEGNISTDTIQHSVRLSKSSNYFYNKPALSVSGAMVSISDGDSTVLLDESQKYPGTYLTDPDFYGVPGKTYTLTISHVDVNENGVFEEYNASSELKPIIPIDSIQLEQLAGNNYNKLRNNVRLFYEIEMKGITDEKELTKKLRMLSGKRDNLNKESPQIPKRAYEKAKEGIEKGESTYRVRARNMPFFKSRERTVSRVADINSNTSSTIVNDGNSGIMSSKSINVINWLFVIFTVVLTECVSYIASTV